jgi:hypothetical protein
MDWMCTVPIMTLFDGVPSNSDQSLAFVILNAVKNQLGSQAVELQ